MLMKRPHLCAGAKVNLCLWEEEWVWRAKSFHAPSVSMVSRRATVRNLWCQFYSSTSTAATPANTSNNQLESRVPVPLHVLLCLVSLDLWLFHQQEAPVDKQDTLVQPRASLVGPDLTWDLVESFAQSSIIWCICPRIQSNGIPGRNHGEPRRNSERTKGEPRENPWKTQREPRENPKRVQGEPRENQGKTHVENLQTFMVWG